ncbi:hypothetical protein JMY81_21295 [Brenneria goodwinii]|uniref:hypothetical protein n=1 Tax=Brenneria goodwinii TaxID=1109412 RepID=UPI000EF1B856|nr:hypothetical protein [Brenneria goodwinii]MCG8156396.1 hypothetical protein [Brenneria goodwinii]MCG8163329.1 hypothetical protein [Brenneria goodwinii]MCG8167749.1 hypothetical protein [Brenneria goodwinii]MCG8172226.1 hypothetical protein [Brenneria goodwinii]MCG8175203.1 hypothetical protein [Brenneria goodwinii]
MPQGLQDYGQSVSSLYTNTNLTDEEGNVLNPVTEEERQYAAHKLLTGTIPEGQDPVRGLLTVWGAGMSVVAAPVFLPSMLSAGAILGGGAISGAANVSNQLMGDGPFSTTDALIATGLGAVTQGRGFWFTEAASVAGAYAGAKLQNKDPLTASIAAGVGSAFGYGANKVVTDKLAPAVGRNVADLSGTVGGSVVSEAVGKEAETQINKRTNSQ